MTLRLIPVCDDCGDSTGRLGTYEIESLQAFGGQARITLDPPTCVCLTCYRRAKQEAEAQGLTLQLRGSNAVALCSPELIPAA